MPTLSSSLHVVESGPADGPATVFLHGAGISSWSWAEVTGRLADRHCMAVDLPEHGGSAAVSPFAFDDTVEALAELVAQRCDGGRAALVGLSLGGQLGLALALRHPERVSGAVLSGVNVRGIPGIGMAMPLIRTSGWMLQRESLVRASARKMHIPAEHLEAFTAETKAATGPAMARWYAESASFRLPRDGALAVRAPVLVLAGSREPGLIRKSLADIANRVEGVTTALVEGAVHTWPLGQPGRFATVTSAWLERGELSEALRAAAG